MTHDRIVQLKDSVTVVVSRTVYPGHERDYEKWVRRMVKAALEAPGNTGVTTLIPGAGKTGLYHVVFQFADRASVEQWENSDIRKTLSAEADKFSRFHRQESTGLEKWFDIPDCPQLDTPPHWKMAAVTALAVYIVSAAVIKLMGVFNLGWNFFLENILVSVLVVAALTWGVMPFFSRVVFRKWLYRR